MNQSLSTQLLAKTLAATVSVFMFSSVASAATAEQQQIQELRKEIEALKAIVMQQQQVQQKQAVQLQQTQVAPAQTASVSIPKALTTSGGAEVKLYGFARADANYILEGTGGDFGNVAKTDGLTKDKFVATAKATRIGLDFKTNVQGANVGGKVEADFADGDTERFRIRHAYLTYNNWLVGQTTSNFLSNHAPFMIDFATNVGGGTARLPQVRYAFDLAPATKLFVALEEAQTTGGGLSTTKNDKGDITSTSLKNDNKSSSPALTAKVNYNFADKAGNASARALLENTKAENIDKRKLGWGLAAGITYDVLEELKLTADTSYTKGTNGLLYGSNATGAYYANAVTDKVEQNEIWAVQTGATYSILPNLKTTIGYGALFADKNSDFAKSNLLNDLANKEVQEAWINFVYSPVKPLDFGIEYVNGERKTFANNKYKENRLGFMAKYSF